MSDAVDRGITVTEIAARDTPVDVSPETTAAFIGRALRGPLDTPVLVENYGGFRRRFGDSWSRSSLGPAVKQFFDNGGKRLYVVRVANNARGALICVPASGSALVLRALEPGSTEHVRVAVDYDRIEDDEHFNLTIQRVDPVSGLIVDQEIHKRLSYVETSETFVADMLLSSSLVRVEQPFATHRPDQTTREANRYELAWIEPVQPGADGTELSDYDLVGSLAQATGLFALEQVEHFDLLYLPPPGKGVDTGPAAILAAEQYCRRRGAMLISDPSAKWTTAEDAVHGVGDLGYASPNMMSYYPRVRERGDRTGAATQSRAAGAAIAGLLCKLDRRYGPWVALDRAGLGLSRALAPIEELDDEDAQLLRRAGINLLLPGNDGRARLGASMTMGRGSESHRVFRNLPIRRTCLRVVNTVDLATRWAVFEKPDINLTEQLRGQILAYLHSLADCGAFENDRFVVQCDAGLCKRDDQVEHGVTILLVFHPAGSPVSVSFTIHQTVAGCRVTSTAFAPVAEHCA